MNDADYTEIDVVCGNLLKKIGRIFGKSFSAVIR
jgi:hypothetical protein